ncbi:tRNA(Met) cytidine acetyltransferase TmcA [Proteus hauseri]|uniref:tRNA(Met) cytidine acetyltransferase TmcA n=1 Tax=Proteus hauseri TaxID=183417 RepID=UPI001009611C|nr:GNAT family N-acetyltransferase [Proteus hauseri]QAV25020.1 tRNA(Met) cytidine acetyltransferase [Proteus hauseri]
MPLLELQRYQANFAQKGQRRLLLLAGDKTWQLAQIQQLRQVCLGDWLMISQNYIDAIIPNQAINLLGNEYLHGIFDANEEFNADALAMLTGTLKAGSWLVLCLPSLNYWERYIDGDSRRWNDMQTVLPTPNFMAWLKDITLNDPQTIIWQQSQPLQLPELNQNLPLWTLPQGQPTKEQQVILEKLLMTQKGVWSVIAPRGRGKSALAGMFIEQWQGSVIVCAPAKNSTNVLSSHTNKPILFYSPDNLLALCSKNQCDKSDWLIIDEAAALPIAQLVALCSYFPRVLMTTTVQGYEGTGRGFMLKLGDSLPLLQTLQLETPIRWAKHDPLEHWLNQLLLLDEPNYYLDKQQGEVTIVQQKDNWNQDVKDLQNFYRLLTSAHYRTTPLDFRRLLDGQKQSYWSASVNQTMIGAVWCIDEGELPETLAQEVWLGIRRPRGNLVAQSLVTYGLTIEAMCLKSLRISRIAVLPPYRRQKVAVNLIKHIVKDAQAKHIDYLSVSFGYTDALAKFWTQCGFNIVRLGVHKEASSGCYTAMAIYPLNKKGEQQQQIALISLALQYQYIKKQTGIDLSISQCFDNNLIQQGRWLFMAGFAFAYRSALTVYDSMADFLIGYELDYPLLAAYFIDKKSDKECVKQFLLSGKKALMTALRQQCAQLMSEYDVQLTQDYQQWLATYPHFSWANRPHHPIYH